MINSKFFGPRKIVYFMNIWLNFVLKNQDSCIITSYESLKSNTKKELRRICDFMGVHCSNDTLKRAVEACEFSKMQKREESGSFRSPRLRAMDVTNQESYKVRKGTVGQYARFFSRKQIKVIDRIIEKELDDSFPYKART
jgi:hypothetical protein